MFSICFVAINWLSFFREFYSIFWVFSSSVFWLGILFCHFCCQYKKKSFLQFICIYFVYLHFLCGSTSGKKIKKNHLFIFIYLLLCCYYLLHLFFLWASLDLGNNINRAAIFLSKQIFLFFLLYSGVMSFNWVVTLRFETKFDTFILHTNPCFGAQTFDLILGRHFKEILFNDIIHILRGAEKALMKAQLFNDSPYILSILFIGWRGLWSRNMSILELKFVLSNLCTDSSLSRYIKTSIQHSWNG